MMSMMNEIDVDTDSAFMAAYDTKLEEKTGTETDGMEESKAKRNRKKIPYIRKERTYLV